MDTTKTILLPSVGMRAGPVQLRAPVDELDLMSLVEEWQAASRKKQRGKYVLLRFATLGLCWPEAGMGWSGLDECERDLLAYGRGVAAVLKHASTDSMDVLAAKGDVCAALLFRRLYPKDRADEVEGNSDEAERLPNASASHVPTSAATPSAGSA